MQGHSDRIPALDLIRGIAVLGILVVNVASFAAPESASVSPNLPRPGTAADSLAFMTVMILFEGKMRALFTLRVHDLSQAILTPPRALVGNFINAMAALRALSRYAQAVRTGRRLAWDKTIHRFPGFSP